MSSTWIAWHRIPGLGEASTRPPAGLTSQTASSVTHPPSTWSGPGAVTLTLIERAAGSTAAEVVQPWFVALAARTGGVPDGEGVATTPHEPYTQAEEPHAGRAASTGTRTSQESPRILRGYVGTTTLQNIVTGITI
jgi:hypothetical protein